MWRSFAALALLGAMACGSTEPSVNPYVGFYNLVSVNGRALPAAVAGNSYVLAGSIALNADGSFALIQRDSAVGAPPMDGFVRGRWTTDGNALTLADTSGVNNGTTQSGTVSSGALVLTFPTLVWRYER